ncbi:hypothetical protein A4A49_38645 [Nicotiana attenuata]|uniref:Uncharacterized protein n=1 Tax=Nicotiana attenuata TaxID=49451 RepID=A0A1J6KBZ7_NICAT|nr:hypothetical protein A4A49_38645 [Nicotiana attenuata]
MATLVPAENWACIDGYDDFSNFEVSQIDGEIVMSLLDDMQSELGDDHDDDERLTSVIRSLEAEIDLGQSRPAFTSVVSDLTVRVHGHDSFQDRNYNLEDLQSRDIVAQCQSQDFAESNDLDFSWMEMEIEMASSYPTDGMNLWYMDTNYGQDHEVDDGISDYTDTVFFEGNDYHSLWQELNA